MKRVLMALSTSRQGGAERIAHHIAEELAHDHSISIAYLKNRPSEAPGWGTILFGKFDVIHSHLFLPGLALRIRRLWDWKFVWVHTVHYADYKGQRGARLKQYLDRQWIFPAPDALVAVSETAFDSIAEFENAVTIRNAVQLPDPGPRVPRSDGAVIGTIAMLRHEKGIGDLLSAFAKLRERGAEVKLKIAGSGPLLGSLQLKTRRLGISGAVEFCGFVKDTHAFLDGLDVYVQPSLSESFGLATLEAMAHGLPIVASHVGHLPRLLANGEFGMLVKRGESFADDLARALADCASRWNEFSGRASRGAEFWRANLSFEHMMEEHRRLYHRLLSPGICMIAPIVTQSTGGLQRQLFLQSRELESRGYQVFVLQRRDSRLLRPGPLREKWGHVRFLMPASPPVLQPFPRLQGLWFVISAFGKIGAYNRKIRLIHAHQLFSPTLVGALAKWCFNIRLVVKVTASGALGEFRQLRRLPFLGLRRVFFRAVDAVIVLNGEMRDEMLQLGFAPSSIHLIPNGVECPQRPAEASPQSVFRLLYCGRLSTEKSLDTLIEAADILTWKGHPVEVHLVGGADPDRDSTSALKRRSAELGVEVRFHGLQKDVSNFYSSADAFVLPSLSEGLSNALLEALANGMACVASDIPPNRFVIEDGVSGLLFRTGNAEDLASKIEFLIRDRALGGEKIAAFRQAAFERARCVFSTQAIGAEIRGLYERLGVSP